MLRYFEVNNYRNFSQPISFDFGKVGGYKFNQECVTNGLIGKSIIYGRNSTGKTNFGEAICDILNILRGGYNVVQRGRILNADSGLDLAFFKYVFDFDGTNVVYEYHRDANYELTDEKMVIDGAVGFDLNYEKREFDSINLSLINAESIQIDKYLKSLDQQQELEDSLVRLPFFRYLISNTAYTYENPLKKLEDYVLRIRMIRVNNLINRSMPGGRSLGRSFVDYLAGVSGALLEFQTFLNDMGIECELYVERLPDGNNELYFKHVNPIPFYDTASSGTLSLANMYMRFIFSNRNMSLLYLDEFDAFYHYDLANKMVGLLKEKYPQCQIVMTTHNTNLMSNQMMRPDCLFILSSYGTITALCDATERELREGHNLEKLYIGGEFEKYE